MKYEGLLDLDFYPVRSKTNEAIDKIDSTVSQMQHHKELDTKKSVTKSSGALKDNVDDV
jgi:hypothetical protein